MTPTRIIRPAEITPSTPYVCALPDGWVLINPTADELRILELFALNTPVQNPAEAS